MNAARKKIAEKSREWKENEWGKHKWITKTHNDMQTIDACFCVLKYERVWLLRCFNVFELLSSECVGLYARVCVLCIRSMLCDSAGMIFCSFLQGNIHLDRHCWAVLCMFLDFLYLACSSSIEPKQKKNSTQFLSFSLSLPRYSSFLLSAPQWDG